MLLRLGPSESPLTCTCLQSIAFGLAAIFCWPSVSTLITLRAACAMRAQRQIWRSPRSSVLRAANLGGTTLTDGEKQKGAKRKHWVNKNDKKKPLDLAWSVDGTLLKCTKSVFLLVQRQIIVLPLVEFNQRKFPSGSLGFFFVSVGSQLKCCCDTKKQRVHDED